MEPALLSRETIAAVSSGMTESGIGIIRISGPEAFCVADKICRLRCGRPVSKAGSHVIRYGTVVEAEDKAAGNVSGEAAVVEAGSGHVIDEALFMIMRGPRTYTGEDTVEINCHGGPAVMRKILRAVLKSGARTAEPGEFTKRAFLNGRIDLSEAEAVMDVIAAKSDDAVRSAVKVLRGSVRHEIEEVRALLLAHIARIEAGLDDPEHLGFEDEETETGADVTDESDDHAADCLSPGPIKSSAYRGILSRDVTKARQKLQAMLAHYDEGRYIREGIRTVILGKPNAGKSSLLNLMAGEDRAIVTEIPGTTRDTLEETVDLGGMTLLLTDTAGIRKTDETVEKIGVERARRAADDADLILFVADVSRPLDENDAAILSFLCGSGSPDRPNRQLIILLNKSDLVGNEDRIRAIKGDILRRVDRDEVPVIIFSATEGVGKDELALEIRELFMRGDLVRNEEVTVTSERQREALKEAVQALDMVGQSLEDQMPEDFYAIDLMGAYAALGRILGVDVGEDVINEVFARFCMGK